MVKSFIYNEIATAQADGISLALSSTMADQMMDVESRPRHKGTRTLIVWAGPGVLLA